jgi:hypothetical protein
MPASLEAHSVRRLAIALTSAVVLVLGVAGAALAWQQPQLQTDCMPDEETYAWWITLPGVEDNYNFDWSFNSNFSGATTVDAGGTAAFYFTTPLPDTDPPHTLYVRWSSDHNAKNSAAANTEPCQEPEEPGIDIDKWPSDGEGSLIDEPIEASEVTYVYEIHNTGNTVLSIEEVTDHISGTPVEHDGEVACEPEFDEQATADFAMSDDDDLFEPGETWVYTCTTLVEVTTVNNACVYANVFHPNTDVVPVQQDGQFDVQDCAPATVTIIEGDEGGGQGTPAGGSIPDTATSLSSQSNPLATLIFGLAMISALGGLAFVNVRASNRR